MELRGECAHAALRSQLNERLQTRWTPKSVTNSRQQHFRDCSSVRTRTRCARAVHDSAPVLMPSWSFNTCCLPRPQPLAQLRPVSYAGATARAGLPRVHLQTLTCVLSVLAAVDAMIQRPWLNYQDHSQIVMHLPSIASGPVAFLRAVNIATDPPRDMTRQEV